MSQKERIIDQTMVMFVSQGIKAVRMDDIAQQLSVSKRTLYELFGDKEELLFQAMCHYFDLCEVHHQELIAHAENVLHALFMVLNDVNENSEESNRIIANLQKFYPAVYDRLLIEGSENHRLCIRQCLEQGIEEGLFLRNLNRELTMSMLFYMASALFARRGGVNIPEGMSEHKAHIEIVTTFFRGISTIKGIEMIDAYTTEQHNTNQEK